MPAARVSESQPRTEAGADCRNPMTAYRRMLCETTDPVERKHIIELMTQEIRLHLFKGN